MTSTYNPAAQFEVKEWDVDFRQVPTRMLKARVYQPQGPGPFPTLLDLHGGAWHDKDRFANVPMCQAVAKSGVLVVAIDMRNSPEAPYPGSVQDAHYGVRWLKSKAREWKGDPQHLGVLGSSSGGHVAELLGMRPFASLPSTSAAGACPGATECPSGWSGGRRRTSPISGPAGSTSSSPKLPARRDV